MCLAQGPQRSDAGEARTRSPSVSSQALYHWATALPVTSCTPNIAHSESEDTSPSSLTPHIQRTIDLLFRRSCCKSGAVGAQVSLPCNRAERTQGVKTFQWVLRDTCLDVRIGRSLLNFPQAVLHLVTMASLHPPPAHSMSPSGDPKMRKGLLFAQRTPFREKDFYYG